MAPSFFTKSELAVVPTAAYRTPRCGTCGLYKGCKSPKMPVYGDGRRGILVVGEAPGQEEDERGVPFVGKTGQYLQRVLRDCDVNLFTDCWVTNAARCRPFRNELPDKSIDFCRPYVTRDIERLKPKVILLLGKAAVRSVLGALGRSDEDTKAVGKWVGWRIPDQKWNAWLCPTYHPSHVLRSLEEKSGPGRVVAAEFARHVKAAVAKTARPWKEVPDWKSEVRVIYDPEEAADAVDGFRRSGRAVSWDIESNCLKPDSVEAEIVSCAISDGEHTVSFPWHGRAVQATKTLLVDPNVPKVGFNIKFESRWVWAKLGVWVKGWVHDGMLAAHCLDTRPGITGLKMQSFVRLGQPDYSSHIEPYLRGEGGNGRNKIRECDLTALLTYGGLDAKLEMLVAYDQLREMGVRRAGTMEVRPGVCRLLPGAHRRENCDLESRRG